MPQQVREFVEDSQCKEGEAWVCCELKVILPTTSTVATTTKFVPIEFDLPVAPDCGTDSGDRIVGGDVTRIDEFPWIAQLVRTVRMDRKLEEKETVKIDC